MHPVRDSIVGPCTRLQSQFNFWVQIKWVYLTEFRRIKQVQTSPFLSFFWFVNTNTGNILQFHQHRNAWHKLLIKLNEKIQGTERHEASRSKTYKQIKYIDLTYMRYECVQKFNGSWQIEMSSQINWVKVPRASLIFLGLQRTAWRVKSLDRFNEL